MQMLKISHVSFLLAIVSIITVFATLYVSSLVSEAIARKARQLNGNSELTEVGSKNSNDPFKIMSALSSKSKNTSSSRNESIEPSIDHEEPVPKTRSPPSGSGSRWTPL